mgnify:CR=1 FL=1
MVKNTKGGNKAKGQARKFVNEKPSSFLRVSQDELEMYAQVIRNLGNRMCHVTCLDGKTRLCIIRGKFSGRGKRDNIIGINSWILVGLREWEQDNLGASSGSAGGGDGDKKMQKCDLLEVYSDLDKEKLKSTVRVNWSRFIQNDNNMVASKRKSDDDGNDGGEDDDADIGFEFVNEATNHSILEYQEWQSKATNRITLSGIKETNTNTNTKKNYDDEDNNHSIEAFDIDDI